MKTKKLTFDEMLAFLADATIETFTEEEIEDLLYTVGDLMELNLWLKKSKVKSMDRETLIKESVKYFFRRNSRNMKFFTVPTNLTNILVDYILNYLPISEMRSTPKELNWSELGTAKECSELIKLGKSIFPD